MKSARVFIFMLIFALVLPLLGSINVQAQDVTTVTWWTDAGDHIPVIQDAFVKSFNESHSDIQVEVIGQANLNDVLRTAFLAGEAPDIVQSPAAAFIAEYHQAGLLMPLGPYAEQWGWKDLLLPWAYESGIMGDELYSVPLHYESEVLFFNKAVFEQNGWEPPTTMQEVNDLADKIEAVGLHVFAFGNASWKAFNELLMSVYLNNYAGPENVYKALIGEKSWTDPEFAEATELLRTHIADKGWYSGNLENYYAYSDADYYGEFAAGEAAMILCGSYAFDAMVTYFTGDAAADWDWVPIPMFREGIGDYIYLLATGDTLSINGSSKHPDAAAEVINYLLSNKDVVLNTAAPLAFGRWMVPLHFDESDFPEGSDSRIVRFYTDFTEVTSEGRYGYTTWTFWPAKPDVQLWEDVELVWAGDMSVEEYLAVHQQLWDEARDEGVTLPVLKRE